MDYPEEWQVVSSEKIADCQVFNVRRDLSKNQTSGKTASFFVIENPDWVNVIPITKEGEVLLIEQFRHGSQEVTLEIPGGMVDDNESPLIAAGRELTEETGYVAGDIKAIGVSSPNPALQNNLIHHFVATNCELETVTKFDEHESIATRLVKLEDVSNLISSGKIVHSLVVAAFFYMGDMGDRNATTA